MRTGDKVYHSLFVVFVVSVIIWSLACLPGDCMQTLWVKLSVLFAGAGLFILWSIWR